MCNRFEHLSNTENMFTLPRIPISPGEVGLIGGSSSFDNSLAAVLFAQQGSGLYICDIVRKYPGVFDLYSTIGAAMVTNYMLLNGLKNTTIIVDQLLIPEVKDVHKYVVAGIIMTNARNLANELNAAIILVCDTELVELEMIVKSDFVIHVDGESMKVKKHRYITDLKSSLHNIV